MIMEKMSMQKPTRHSQASITSFIELRLTVSGSALSVVCLTVKGNLSHASLTIIILINPPEIASSWYRCIICWYQIPPEYYKYFFARFRFCAFEGQGCDAMSLFLISVMFFIRHWKFWTVSLIPSSNFVKWDSLSVVFTCHRQSP